MLLLEQVFDKLIDSFLVDNVGIAMNFMPETMILGLRNNLLQLFAQSKMKEAKIGNKANKSENSLIRTDQIYWLDRDHNDIHENSFFDLMDAFVLYLNRTCYTGIKSYEFHYAMYDEGSFYKKHLDQFKSDQGRAFSMITYLNEDWVDGDGGELCIYHKDHTQTLDPIGGKSTFFKSSELEHEVLLSHKKRLSITGWLKTTD